MTATPKQSTELMTYFAKTCPSAPRFNRATAKWAARDLIDSYGMDTCRKAIQWYGRVNRSPDWNGFIRSADACVREMELYNADKEKRRKFRSIADEWRNA